MCAIHRIGLRLQPCGPMGYELWSSGLWFKVYGSVAARLWTMPYAGLTESAHKFSVYDVPGMFASAAL